MNCNEDIARDHTSRLRELAKRLGVTTTISAAFQQESGVALSLLGYHALRDVDVEQPIFTLPSAVRFRPAPLQQ